MNHKDYPKSLRNKSEAELRFIVRDCQEALEANPTSAKANDYQGEILYVAAELNRRNKYRGDDPRPLVWSSDYEYEARNGERWYFERDLGHGFVRTINADGVRATYHKSGRVSPHMETHEDIVAVRLIAELLQ